MITIDLAGKSVLITGGTQGIGKASALELALSGAQVFVTCKWGSVDPDDLRREFEEAGAAGPIIIEADVSRDDDTDSLLGVISEKSDSLDIFISNVGFAPQINELDDYVKRSFFKTLEYSSWPLIEYTKKIKQVFGKYPKKVIGISSDGPDHFYRGYDFVSASKALLEHFSKYLAIHLQPDGGSCNILRFGTVKTPSFSAIFGEEFFEFARNEGIPENLFLTAEQCGKSVLALCSGLLEPLNGQIITVDHGLPFQDNLMMRYIRSKEQHTKK
ncbi:MAG: SDR family oxidoreductase [Spirochaetales bacterium]|jgi:NAD(P)-dependent dehydrogenase (short-subunit alcohol dehydrogenase family)|nr:SDR family oxidoreductase [Spirochaetales bacterium]